MISDITANFIVETCNKIIDSITLNDHIAVLNNTSLALGMFDKEFLKANKILELQKSIDKILNNEKHMRILRLMQTIKTEVDSRIFYYDRDYGSDIRKAVAVIIQEIDQEEETPNVD